MKEKRRSIISEFFHALKSDLRYISMKMVDSQFLLRTGVVLLTLFFSVSVLYLVIDSLIRSDFFSDVRMLVSKSESAFNLMVGTVTLIFVAFIILSYLQKGIGGNRRKDGKVLNEMSSLSDYDLERLTQRISELGKQVRDQQKWLDKADTTQIGLSENEKQQLINSLKAQIKLEASSKVLEDLKKQLIKEMKLEDVRNECFMTIDRLKNEVSALTRRANLNLVIGILITIVGLGILLYYVSITSIDLNKPLIAVAAFIPRLTLVIFIEIFAYFFLKLYKSNLSEIKYFQNELTNIEAKYLSLKMSVFSYDQDILAGVIKTLSTTERNTTNNRENNLLGSSKNSETIMNKEIVLDTIKTLNEIVKKLR